jgi:predicted RND superfamily exporter protein
MMSEHQIHTEFLRHCLRYGESDEHQALDKRITQIQRDERCVQRAVWLMAVFTALAVAVLGFPAILVENFPYNVPQFTLNLVCALGLASLVCLLVFVGLGMVYRNKLNQRREESRLLVTKLLASRLGKPVPTPARDLRDNRAGEGDGQTVRIASESMILQ